VNMYKRPITITYTYEYISVRVVANGLKRMYSYVILESTNVCGPLHATNDNVLRVSFNLARQYHKCSIIELGTLMYLSYHLKENRSFPPHACFGIIENVI